MNYFDPYSSHPDRIIDRRDHGDTDAGGRVFVTVQFTDALAGVDAETVTEDQIKKTIEKSEYRNSNSYQKRSLDQM